MSTGIKWSNKQGRIQDFCKGCVNLLKGGSFSMFNMIFLKFSHENEIIWSGGGGGGE